MNKIFDDKWKKKPSKKELYDLINCYTKEIERLNNIINEIRRLLKEEYYQDIAVGKILRMIDKDSDKEWKKNIQENLK